jgi:protein subunit release factor B
MDRINFTLNKKDFEYQWFSGKGAGGQHRNKHQNCFRIRHIASGVSAVGQSHRERKSNMREAMQTLIKNPIFKSWCNLKLKELEFSKNIHQIVEEQMKPKNLKIELRIDNKWTEV